MEKCVGVCVDLCQGVCIGVCECVCVFVCMGYTDTDFSIDFHGVPAIPQNEVHR